MVVAATPLLFTMVCLSQLKMLTMTYLQLKTVLIITQEDGGKYNTKIIIKNNAPAFSHAGEIGLDLLLKYGIACRSLKQ